MAKIHLTNDEKPSLKEKITDMLYRMRAGCEDEAPSFMTEKETRMDSSGITEYTKCTVHTNSYHAMSEVDIYTFLEESNIFDRKIVVDDTGRISLEFNTYINDV